MSPKIRGWQLKYTILSTTINIMASRTLLLDVAPSKILGHLSYHKSLFCQVLQNALHFYRTFQKKYMGDNLQSMESWNGRIRTCASCRRLCALLELRSNRCRVPSLHRASFGLFPWADAAQFNGQAVTPDRCSKYIHKEVKKR